MVDSMIPEVLGRPRGEVIPETPVLCCQPRADAPPPVHPGPYETLFVEGKADTGQPSWYATAFNADFDGDKDGGPLPLRRRGAGGGEDPDALVEQTIRSPDPERRGDPTQDMILGYVLYLN